MEDCGLKTWGIPKLRVQFYPEERGNKKIALFSMQFLGKLWNNLLFIKCWNCWLYILKEHIFPHLLSLATLHQLFSNFKLVMQSFIKESYFKSLELALIFWDVFAFTYVYKTYLKGHKLLSWWIYKSKHLWEPCAKLIVLLPSEQSSHVCSWNNECNYFCNFLIMPILKKRHFSGCIES